LPFDLAEIDDKKDDLISKVSKISNQVDTLVNNAGLLINKPFADITPEEELKVFQVNYFAPSMLTRIILPFLKRSEHGSVVNVASMGAVQGSSKFPGLAAYSASKGALVTLTESLAEEFKSLNVRVNALAIGAVETEMLYEAFPGYKAGTSAQEMAGFMKWFIEEGYQRFNGKIIPVSDSTP
jgi:short-subunit dehydrogenase